MQLVGGDGEEVVAQHHRLSRRLVEARILDGQTGPLPEPFADGEILLAVAPAGQSAHERDGADDSLAPQQRDRHVRAGAQLAEEIGVLRAEQPASHS